MTADRILSYPLPQVFNKERTQRAKQAREAGTQFSDKLAGNEDNTHALSPGRPRAHTTNAHPIPRRVDSIVEDEEEPIQAGPTTMSATVTEPPRVRQASKSFTSASAASAAAARYRSVSISDSPHPRHDHRRSQDKLPNGAPVPPRIDTQNTQRPARHNPKSTPAGMPTRTRKVARNRESLDLDDVMNGSGEEGEEEVVSPSAPPRTPTRVVGAATPITPGKPRTPHVSAAARELIAFLDEGPPEEVENPRSSVANASVISFESSKTARTGKLSRMMSRLTIKNGGSTERLNGRYGDDVPKTPKTPRTLGRKPSANFGPPPTAYNPTLTNKRSFPNVVVSPPRAPPYHGHGHGDGMQTPTPPQSISSGTRVVSPSPTASTAPLIPRTVSTASSTSEESQALSPRTRKGSAAWDEFGSPTSMSRDSSLRAQVANGSQRLRVVNGEGREVEEDRPLAVKTNGYVASPTPRNNDDRIVSPTTPRRSPIPRKPAPSPVHENGRTPVARETPPVSRKPSATASLAPPPGPPAIGASDVADLRKYLQRASTVDECRLLVDMFFASHGFPAKPPSDDAVPSLPELSRFMSLNELDASYAELFLAPDHIDFHSLADETSSEGSAASSRDFTSPTSETSVSPPPPALATVQE